MEVINKEDNLPQNKIINIALKDFEKANFADTLLVTHCLTNDLYEKYKDIKINSREALSKFNGKIVFCRFGGCETLRNFHYYKVCVVGDFVSVKDIMGLYDSVTITRDSVVYFTYKSYITFEHYDHIVHSKFNVMIPDHAILASNFLYNNGVNIYKIKN